MPTTNLWPIDKGTNGGFWDLMQILAAALGQNDIGAFQAFQQISAPAAPTATVNAVSGNLTGNYQYAVAFITGYLQGDPQNAAAGTLHKFGNTGGGTASATVSPNGQQVNLSNIPIGGTGVVARVLYRTKAGGSTFYFLTEIDDNTTTTFPDNITDASLGAQMPTTNSTGSWFQGKFVGTDQLAPFQWPVLTAMPPVGPAGTVILYKSPSGTISLYGSDGTQWNQISGGGTTADFYSFSATAGQSVINLPNGKAYTPGTNTVELYVEGDFQDPQSSFTETSSSQLTLNGWTFSGGEDVLVRWFKQLPSGSSVPIATQTTLGGIKGSSTIAIGADGTASVTTGAANGVAGLDSGGQVPLSQLNNISGEMDHASYTASAGQTVFTLPNGKSYSPGQNTMEVYIRGVFQDPASAFTETNSTTVTLASGLVGSEDVVLKWYKTTPAAITSLPVATSTTLGAVKGSSTINIGADGTANLVTSVPETWTAKQTFNNQIGLNGMTLDGAAGRFYVEGIDGSKNLWFGTGSATEPGDLGFGWQTDGAGSITQINIGAGNNPPVNIPGNVTIGGTLMVGGKPAGGPLASAKEVEVTGTTAQNILAYTPTTADNYTVKVYFRVVTAATTITLAVTYTDVTGAQTTTLINATSMAVGSYSETPLFINSVSGQPITVTVTAGTANQVYVSASITEG